MPVHSGVTRLHLHHPKPSGEPTKAGLPVVRYLVAVVVPVMVMIPETAMITIMAAVPAVVMFKPAAISLPVTVKEPLSIMMRSHPPSPAVRWPSPITLMPLVMPSHRIPVTIYPCVFRAWSCRQNTDHTGPRWRANSDSNDLSAGDR